MTGAGDAGAELAELTGRGRALNSAPVIDRDLVWQCKRAAASLLFERLADGEALDAHIAAQGPGLRRFCEHSAMVEVHGADWRLWPPALRDARPQAVSAFARREAARVR